MTLGTIQLATPDWLNEGNPLAQQQYQGPDGRLHTVLDTRPPLHRMRRTELMKLAAEQGFDVSRAPRKDDLIKMLEAPRSVRAQLTRGGNLAQATAIRQQRVQGSAEATNRGPAQIQAAAEQGEQEPLALQLPSRQREIPTYVPREPEPHEIEAAKEAARFELGKMPFFKLKSVLSARGIDYQAGQDRKPLIEDYLKSIDADEGAML